MEIIFLLLKIFVIKEMAMRLLGKLINETVPQKHSFLADYSVSNTINTAADCSLELRVWDKVDAAAATGFLAATLR